jgi:transposase-like protein
VIKDKIRNLIMQEKKDNASVDMPKRRYTTEEERQSLVEDWKKSGLSMSEYCRQNNLALASLSEWKRSILRNKIQFKEVKSQASTDTTTPSNIIEIILDQRIKIRLQQVTDVSLLIKIAKGLMACN